MHRLSPMTTAILSAQRWDILDFEDVHKELANKLTDDDLYAILTCINARDVLKRLKLCGCINITGLGLNPLRGSVVLEQLDICLVGKHEKLKNTQLKTSEEAIMPILDNIISSEGCSLKHVTFPTPWCRDHGESIEVNNGADQFLQKYNLLFNSRGLSCSHCRTSLRDNLWMDRGNRMIQNNICYDCLKPFCDDCTDANGECNGKLNWCNKCGKDYCRDCVPGTECTGCLGNMCSGCAEACQCQQ